jgi:hypothetical protein
MMEKQNDAEVVRTAAGDADVIDDIIDSANGITRMPYRPGSRVSGVASVASAKPQEKGDEAEA